MRFIFFLLAPAKIAGASLCESSDTCSMTPQKSLLAHGIKLAHHDKHNLKEKSEMKTGQKTSKALSGTSDCTRFIDGALEGVDGVAAKMQQAAQIASQVAALGGPVGEGVSTVIGFTDAIFGGVLVPDENEIRLSALEDATRCLNGRLDEHERRLDDMSSKLDTVSELGMANILHTLAVFKDDLKSKAQYS
mmetsp:Transcript_98245/g.189724  ORF Transcript_98245/g.189724 Transcript_98245/m.189724 type:complete len:191 (-) Transcript_98245:67-639(-)